MKASLTQPFISETECPDGMKILEVFDIKQYGLMLRIYPRPIDAKGKLKPSKKTFWFRCSTKGRRIKYKLGNAVAGMKLTDARDAVKAALGEVGKGVNPADTSKARAIEEKRKADERAFTLGTLIDQWSAQRLKDRRAGYREEASRALMAAFKDRAKKPAIELNKEIVRRASKKLVTAGKDAMAAAVLRYGHAAFGWAISEGLGGVKENPFSGINKPSAVSRDRVLDDSELRAIWQATAGGGSFNEIVRVLMLTGQRRDEVAGMQWSELSADLSVWTLPPDRAKNGVVHIVPISTPVREIIEAAQTWRKGSEFVFPGAVGVYRGWGHSKARLDAAIQTAREKEASGSVDPIPGWRLHDLRRTVATSMQAHKVRLEVVESILNHVSGTRSGVAGIYQRHHWKEEKAEALNAWGARLDQIVTGREPASNVIPLRA